MSEEFFYSPSNNLYIAKEPLKLDSRVKKAAIDAGVSLQWDDEGRIIYADFDDAKKLLAALSSTFLSPPEYWRALKDAEKAKDTEMTLSLTSNYFCEWLDRVYLRDQTYIDHPVITSLYEYEGKRNPSHAPRDRPGWFNPQDNINEEGVPQVVESFRKKNSTHWKYWCPEFSITKRSALAPLRGYITSVGKPSLDLGIPVDARQPVQMIRECRASPLEPPIPQEKIDHFTQIVQDHSLTKEKKQEVLSFIIDHASLLRGSKQRLIYTLRENLFDFLGSLHLKGQLFPQEREQLDRAAQALTGKSLGKRTFAELENFVLSSQLRLQEAMEKKKDMVFVMGHKNPDTDTVVSSLFEAWRNHLLDGESTTYIPILQSENMPPEIQRLLGNILSQAMLTSSNPQYLQAKESGLARWISVDQNREPEVQRYFIAMLDHHAVSSVARSQEIPKTFEPIGSCAGLVYQKLLGMGAHIDQECARILHGATLMDTENRVHHKMTKKDHLLMNQLQSISGIKDECALYSDLMSYLLNTVDALVLFERDYKEDWGFGFAVAKIKGGFSSSGKIRKKSLCNRAVHLAQQNNSRKNFPLTLLRITDYKEDNQTVNHERIYCVFHKRCPQVFRKSIHKALEIIIHFELEKIQVKQGKNYIDFWGTGTQLSRKKTAPILEPLVTAFNEYFYSPTTSLWVKRGFLSDAPPVREAAKRMKLKISFDKEQRARNITFIEVKRLSDELGFQILSLSEYWEILKDANKAGDQSMSKSLQGSNFVEFLDSAIVDKSRLIEHTHLQKKGKKYLLTGSSQKVHIPLAHPGLIHPDQIDPKTGIPKSVRLPNEYGNKELWRYWSPDTDFVIPTRSFIFLLNQPCWDGKVHPEDSFPNLGVRPCYKKQPLPLVSFKHKKNILTLAITRQGKKEIFTWKK